MEIDNINSKATVTETADISRSICDTLEKAAIVDTYLELECSVLKATVAAMRKVIGTERGKAMSEAVYDADAKRDNLLLAINSFIKGFQYWQKTDTFGAANRLSKIIAAYGNRITHLSYEKESAAMDAMLEKLEEPETEVLLETLNLKELIDELKAAQSNFKLMYQQSAETESLKGDTVSASSLRPQATNQLSSIITYLNVMNKANHAVYGAVAATIAELVNTINGKIRSRYSDDKSDDTTAES